MHTLPSPDHPSQKREKLTSWATLIFHLLRMFWVTELALLVVVLLGLYAGWSMRVQWSDAFFYAAVAQIFIAAVPLLGSQEEIESASFARNITNGDVSETRRQLEQVAMGKESFSVRVFIGGLLTILIAVLITRL